MAYYDVDEEKRTRLPAWLAREDCERRNSQNFNLFTKEEISFGEQIRQRASNIFLRSRVFLNYRETFIAVKVEAPKIADKLNPEYSQLLKFAKDNKIRVKKGRASLIFEIKHNGN